MRVKSMIWATTAGLLAATTGHAQTTSTSLKTGEGIGLSAQVDAFGSAYPGGIVDNRWVYNSTSGGLPIYNYPQGLTEVGNTGPAVLTSTPSPMPYFLTSGGLSLQSAAARGAVSASLPTGEIHSSDFGTQTVPSEGEAWTTGVLSDGLTWNFTGQVTVNLHLEGTAYGPPAGSFTNNLTFLLGGSTGGSVGYQGDNDDNAPCNGVGPGECFRGVGGNWVSYAFSNVSMTSLDFTGVLDVTKGESVSPISLRIEVDPCGFGWTCNFSHTCPGQPWSAGRRYVHIGFGRLSIGSRRRAGALDLGYDGAWLREPRHRRLSRVAQGRRNRGLITKGQSTK